MFAFSLGHLFILLVVVLIFGPKRLSTSAEQLGQAIRDIRNQWNNAQESAGIKTVADSWKNMRDEVGKFRSSLNPLQEAASATTTTSTVVAAPVAATTTVTAGTAAAGAAIPGAVVVATTTANVNLEAIAGANPTVSAELARDDIKKNS